MSFIDELDTGSGGGGRGTNTPPKPNTLSKTGEPSGGFMDSVDTEGSGGFSGALSRGVQSIKASGQEAIYDGIESAQSGAKEAARGFIDRGIDSLGRSIKGALGENVAKHVTNPIKDALGKIGGGLLGDVFDGFMGTGQGDQVVPPQYSGTMDLEQNAHEMYHSDNYAMYKYGINRNATAVNERHPSMKHMFAADFVFNTNSPHYNQYMMKTFASAMTTSLKNTTFPKAEIETDEVNRYNRNIISSKRMRYQPITATFGETVGFNNGVDSNTSMVEIWNALSSFYINDARRPNAFSAPFGHRSGNMSRNIIHYLDLYFIWPTATRRIRLVNPYIVSFSYDNLDYQADEQIQATFDIKYEYYEMTSVNGSFTDFINSPVGQSVLNGTPYEFTNASPMTNTDVASGIGDMDGRSSDDPYANALFGLAEEKLTDAASSLLNSGNSLKRRLGEQIVERTLDAGQSLNEATGATKAVRNMARSVGNSANEALKGLF